MNFDYAIHSGFLIHWTGKDIDCLYDPHWHESDKSKTSKECIDAYISRLTNILEYGLWMTKELMDEKREGVLSFNDNVISIPPIDRVCFTELKLSQSRKHAKKYGRLGIGVKRPFVLERFGRPLIYYHHRKMIYDKFLETCVNKIVNDNSNKYMLNYFKPMNSKDEPLNFDWYAESEWRIIFSKEMSFPKDLLDRKIVDPNDEINKNEYEYFDKLSIIEKNKLRYLIPLDYWFSMIIYPSLEVKNMAYQSDDIRKLIEEIKKRKFSKKLFKDESENQPIELDLDACRNF